MGRYGPFSRDDGVQTLDDGHLWRSRIHATSRRSTGATPGSANALNRSSSEVVSSFCIDVQRHLLISLPCGHCFGSRNSLWRPAPTGQVAWVSIDYEQTDSPILQPHRVCSPATTAARWAERDQLPRRAGVSCRRITRCDRGSRPEQNAVVAAPSSCRWRLGTPTHLSSVLRRLRRNLTGFATYSPVDQ